MNFKEGNYLVYKDFHAQRVYRYIKSDDGIMAVVKIIGGSQSGPCTLSMVRLATDEEVANAVARMMKNGYSNKSEF